MLKEFLINTVLVIVTGVLFVNVHNTLARVCLVAGMLLLIGIVNIAMKKLSVKKDENGNPVYMYYISFRREKDYERAESILNKYGKAGRKTSKYLSLSTAMKLNQVKNAVRSDLKLSENDLEVMKDTFLS